MDSLTHIVLGAAIADLSCGRQLGKKAMLYGAILGTLPDLDVAAGVFMNDVDKIIFHRGITHSLLFWVIMSPVCGWLIAKLEAGKHLTFQRATLMSFAILFTHALIDSFTSYGTRLLIPITPEAYAFSTIAIIDPLYSIWLYAAVPWVLIRRMDFASRHKILIGALIISHIYFGLTLVNKAVVNEQFSKVFADQQTEVTRFISKPNLFSNLLWTSIGETKDGYYTARYPILFGPGEITVNYVEKNHDLIAEYAHTEAMKRLKSVTQGYFNVEEINSRLFVNDLRFGRLSEWSDPDTPYVFSYQLTGSADDLEIKRVPVTLERSTFRNIIRDP